MARAGAGRCCFSPCRTAQRLSLIHILLVGDSLTSDMMGGQNAGIDTCWYNPGGKPNALGVPITYEIARLEELPALVVGA